MDANYIENMFAKANVICVILQLEKSFEVKYL